MQGHYGAGRGLTWGAGAGRLPSHLEAESTLSSSSPGEWEDKAEEGEEEEGAAGRGRTPAPHTGEEEEEESAMKYERTPRPRPIVCPPAWLRHSHGGREAASPASINPLCPGPQRAAHLTRLPALHYSRTAAGTVPPSLCCPFSGINASVGSRRSLLCSGLCSLVYGEAANAKGERQFFALV